MRYDTLSVTKSAYQAALPPSLMETLVHRLGVFHECFASPLNRSPLNRSFCSVFPDVDVFFGSSGNFYSFEPPKPGVYECNPPFDNASVTAAFMRIYATLAAKQGKAWANWPLTVVFTIPEMDMNAYLLDAWYAVRPYCSRTTTAQINAHVYQVGLQHRRTGHGEGDHFWRPEKRTKIYFFQNDAGRKAHPITDDLEEEILHNFDY